MLCVTKQGHINSGISDMAQTGSAACLFVAEYLIFETKGLIHKPCGSERRQYSKHSLSCFRSSTERYKIDIINESVVYVF